MKDESVEGKTLKLQTGCKSLFIIYNEGHSCFVIKGKSGTCLNAMCEAIGRLASELIAVGKLDVVIKQLQDIKCGSPIPCGTNEVGEQKFTFSCPDAIAQGLEKLKGV